MTDAELARRAAEAAGELLLELRAASGLDGRDLGALGDARSEALLQDLLATERPSDAVLSEESADDAARLGSDRVWIVDPLDGTREYGLPGREDWAVHVALWERERGVTAAAVAEPARGRVRSTIDEPAVKPVGSAGSLSLVVSDSRPPQWAPAVADRLGASIATMGSAGAKAMAVLAGVHDAYLHDGGQWEWDSAAPVGVALHHGLHASRVDGAPLVYNRPHPYLPDLLICHHDSAARILAAIAMERVAA